MIIYKNVTINPDYEGLKFAVMNRLDKIQLEYLWGDALNDMVNYYINKGYRMKRIIDEIILEDKSIKADIESW